MVTRIGKISARSLVLSLLCSATIVFPFFAKEASEIFGIQTEKAGFLVAIHEWVSAWFSAWCLYVVHKGNKNFNWEKPLVGMFVFLGLADLAYGIHFYFLKYAFQNTPGFLTHQIPYILFVGLLSQGSIRRAFQGTTVHQKKLVAAAIGLTSAIYFLCSYKMVLSFRFPIGYHRPAANLITSYVYGILQSLSMGGLIVASLRTTGFLEFAQWFLFIAMNGSDFTLRYQDVAKVSLGTSIFEYGWELSVAGFGVIAFLRLLKKGGSEFESNPMPVNSIRVLSPLATLTILLLFISLNLLAAPYFQIANINTMSGHILIFTFVWLMANALGIALSRILEARVAALSEKIESAYKLEDLEVISGDLVELNPTVLSLKRMKGQLSATAEENLKMKSMAVVAATTSRVVHSIRSPLVALEMGINLASEIPNAAESIIRKSLKEIRTFIKDLENKSKSCQVSELAKYEEDRLLRPKSVQLLAPIVEATVAQKKIEYFRKENIKIISEVADDCRELCSEINASDFSMVISNLINNAIEAMTSNGNVTVRLRQESGDAVVEIIDDGPGIAPELLAQLGSPGLTVGKVGGSGRGIHDSKTMLESCSGGLDFFTTPNQGSRAVVRVKAVPSAVRHAD